jgi:hypothetical protein
MFPRATCETNELSMTRTMESDAAHWTNRCSRVPKTPVRNARGCRTVAAAERNDLHACRPRGDSTVPKHPPPPTLLIFTDNVSRRVAAARNFHSAAPYRTWEPC